MQHRATPLFDVVSRIDGKADTGQNRHLKKRQSPENGSQSAHCAHRRTGIHNELKRFPKGVPSWAVPATATASTRMNRAAPTANAIRLKALNIPGINSDACETPGHGIDF